MRSSVSVRWVNKQTTQMGTEAVCSEPAVARVSANILSLEDTQSPAEEWESSHSEKVGEASGIP